MSINGNADFINAVAAGTHVPCTACGEINEAGSRFCCACGSVIEASVNPAVSTDTAPAFEPAAPAFEPAAPAFEPAAPAFEPAAPAFEPAAPAFEPAAPAFEPAAPAFEPAENNAAPAKVEKYVEPNSAFALGLPDWSIEPPQVMVRRRK